MKLKVYLDTSVISYLDQQDAPEKMQETREIWEILKTGDEYEIYISDLVISELNKCKDGKKKLLFSRLQEIKYNLIKIDEEIISLAEKFISSGVLTAKSFEDCQHIAAAIRANCDAIVSWNFRHIVNVKTIKGMKVITTLEGYKEILIYPPSILLNNYEL